MTKITVSASSLRRFVSDSASDQNTIVVKDLNAPVDRMVSVIFYTSAVMGNPQGGIDEDGAPRQNPINQTGIITSVGFKRKIRDLCNLIYGDEMHVRRRSVLVQGTLDAAVAECDDKKLVATLTSVVDAQKAKAAEVKDKDDKGKKEKNDARQDWAAVIAANTKHFYDDRAFGRLFTLPINEGVTGPIQVNHMQSLHPIDIIEIAIATVAVASYKDKADKDSDLGRMSVVNFGLYEGVLTCTPHFARATGFTWNDLNKLLSIMPMIWDLTRSTVRTGISHERMYVFEHDSAYGSAPLNVLRKLVRPSNSETGQELPSDVARQSMDHYNMKELGEIILPHGVNLVVG